MNKKNDLFDDRIRKELTEMKEPLPVEEKKSALKRFPAILIAAVFIISVLLRFFF
ncbi:MAG: hypothetical protein LUG62_06560 [Clostridiales bacterium]|nr:hypothetical protein [Clostridiales bacterium]